MNRQSIEGLPEENYLKHYSGLWDYCYFLSKNKWDADDLVQEAFLKAFQHYGGNEMKKALLKKIAYHQWIDTIRKRNFEKMEPELEKDQVSSLSYRFQIKETLELLFSSLTHKQAVIYVLKEVFLFQIKEIALLMATSEPAVKASLHRSKKRMANQRFNDESKYSVCEDEMETGILLETLEHAIQNQDPDLLLRRIPHLRSLTTQADMIVKPSKTSHHFNFNTLYLAA